MTLNHFYSSKKNKDREVLMSMKDGCNHIVYLKEKRNNVMNYYVYYNIINKLNLVNVTYQYGPYEDPYVAYDVLMSIINNKQISL